MLTFDKRGVHLAGASRDTVYWGEIAKITGYKIDLLTVDEIRFEFELVDGCSVVISEESPGFKELMIEVERHFPSVAGWHAKIALPAFVTSRTVLFAA